MRIVLPSVTYRRAGLRLAPRPATLDGKVLGFLDGWGRREPDGRVGMYPLMEALRDLLVQRYRLAGTLWLRKPSISPPAPPAQLAELVAAADVVINGEAA